MTLHHQSVAQRLETLLKYHGRLVAQNRDKGTMQKVEAEIETTRTELERLNALPMNRQVVR